ncbi:hypothetical protein GIB67_029364 [Kingdonia uniflora]|uniref:Uncharacterized protein n=1 Tax=Kingdonia uniflora TaxID=39325 RepID=A0A7J7NEH9_9MAGN|nr:hypothetical protein GIB67_029364 [Kingdonia uniflora]
MKVQLDPLNADIIGLEKKSAAAYAESLDIEEASLRQASKIDCLLLEIRLVPTFTWWSEGERADIALEVYAVSIVGPFPTAVTNLLDLTRLDLHNNKLTGPIPPQIGRLRRLKILLQEHEKFAGEEDAQDSCARVCSHGWRVDYKSLKIKFRPKPTLELDPDVVAGRGVLTGKVAEDTNPLEIDAEIEPVQREELTDNEDYDANLDRFAIEDSREALPDSKEALRNLRWNKLQDVIPPEIGELKRLTHLYLSFNSFKGKSLRSLQIYQSSAISISMKIVLLGGFLQNLAIYQTFGTCNSFFLSLVFNQYVLLACLSLYYGLKLPLAFNVMTGNTSPLHRDVGNNHLVGTIRELIRLEEALPLFATCKLIP